MPDDDRAVYLLDGYGLIYRAYFAFMRNPMRNAEGRNTSAIFGFFRTLFSLLREHKPYSLAIALDSIGPTFRHQRFAAYKSTRPKTPGDLLEQIPIIEKMLSALGIAMVRAEGYEADDIMASYARRCLGRNIACYVVSVDKDLLQLVEDPVRILRPNGAVFREMGRTQVFEDWRVYPEQIGDYLSLVGDASDNIPGVAGIGAKTAVALLQRFGTLKGIYDNLDTVEPMGWRTKLEIGRDNAFLSRELVTLADDAPDILGVDALRLPTLHFDAARPLFEREGMRSLVSEMQQMATGAETNASPSGEEATAQHETVALDGVAPRRQSTLESHATRTQRYEMIADLQTLERVVDRAHRAGRFAFDSETDNINPVLARPIGFSIAIEPDSGYYIPLYGPNGAVLPEEQTRTCLMTLLCDPAVELVGQNVKYDYKVLKRWGIPIANRLFDTMIAAWLLDTTANSYNLDRLAHQWLNYETIHFNELIPPKKGSPELTFDSVALDRATAYAAEDADIALRLADIFAPRLRELKLDVLMRDTEMLLIPLLGDMELRGIRLDTERLAKLGAEFESELKALEIEIYRLCGYEFNIKSTKQLQVVLFEELGLPHIRKTKTGYSTDTAVLDELARIHPAPAKILRHRLLAKLKSTYVDALPTMVNSNTGRIHTFFNLTGTATGRISSTKPNLQNIPIKDEEGRRIRQAFIPTDGCRFLSVDYSQIELVVLAHLSNDPGLMEAFRNGEDVHRQTGALIFGVLPEQVDAEQRRVAKTINFGVMYGMSAFRLARDLNIPRADADRFLKTYFDTYPGIKSFIARTIRQAEQDEAVYTLLMRRRPLLDINNRNRTVKAGAERIAINTPIQGSAADIMKLAMLRVARRLERDRLEGRIILQVHDELIIEAPEREVEQIAILLNEEMTNAASLAVPLRVNVEIGTNWGELH